MKIEDKDFKNMVRGLQSIRPNDIPRIIFQNINMLFSAPRIQSMNRKERRKYDRAVRKKRKR